MSTLKLEDILEPCQEHELLNDHNVVEVLDAHFKCVLLVGLSEGFFKVDEFLLGVGRSLGQGRCADSLLGGSVKGDERLIRISIAHIYYGRSLHHPIGL